VNSHELVHVDAYYTLNEIPSGEKMVIKPKPAVAAAPPAAKPKATDPKPALASKAAENAIPTDAEIKSLLAKNTCTACHQKDKKQVGPAYVDVAKRNYTPDKMVELIYNPKPENWPDYATPMPQVPREEALKIARWINSLK
jgi:cytochrome c551/c552